MSQKQYQNIYTLKQMLDVAEKKGFAVGAFSPRYSSMITPILKAGQALQSPLMVQVAQIELQWYEMSLQDFAQAFWEQLKQVAPTIPVGLHLDHTQDFALIESAIANGFTSVMIDASALPLEQNIKETRRVVELAHQKGVSVEAELGRIGSADFIETESNSDEELYTDPSDAAYFCKHTQVDALAVSVGTAHGVYKVRQPKVDLERLKAIRALTPVHLVLHGGSGTPADLVLNAIRMPGGGVSKVNIATDLEIALLETLGYEERSTDAVIRHLPVADLERGRAAVQQVVEDKIIHFLASQGQAVHYL